MLLFTIHFVITAVNALRFALYSALKLQTLQVSTVRMKIKNKKLIADIILIFSVLLISALCFIIVSFTQNEGAEVVVTIGNEEYGRFPLNIDKKLTITVDDETNLQYNVLVIENGKADVIEASCPDGVCVDHMPISKSGETIVCLPNKVVVRIESDKNEVDIAA